MVSLNDLFKFVLFMSTKYNIDSSHSENHSMDVLHFADENYNNQVYFNPLLNDQLNVIYTASILHDMCDKKYMKQDEGLKDIDKFLKDKLKPEELFYTKKIMETMSYSTVKKNGYPELGIYQNAYHIVREADLLSSYNFDRSIIYHMNRGNNFNTSYYNALELFENRIFNYNHDKLFISEYAKEKSASLTIKSVNQIVSWSKILSKVKLL